MASARLSQHIPFLTVATESVCDICTRQREKGKYKKCITNVVMSTLPCSVVDLSVEVFIARLCYIL